MKILYKKKIKKFQKFKLVLLILFIFLINISLNHKDVKYNQEQVDLVQDFKSAGVWVLSPIIIDDNGGGDYTWAEAILEEWCTGSGSWSDPYEVKNLIINGLNSTSSFTIRDSSKYFVVENCTFYNAGISPNAGLKLDSVENGLILNNNVSYNNRWGIHLSGCSNCTVEDNTANNNVGNNIFVSNSEHNLVVNNIANDGEYVGIGIENSDYITIYNNTANNNDQAGINIAWRSQYNIIIENNAANNNNYGIWSENNCTYNNFTRNVVENNAYGIGFWQGCNESIITGNIIKENTQYGISIYSYTGIHSDNALIYNNSFIDNANQARDYGLNNQWDNGIIGNYWSDYGGVDADDNGIGDTPYLIDGLSGSQDNFPIWSNTLNILINSPVENQFFKTSAPSFVITLLYGTAVASWYSVDGGFTNISFTGTTGLINQLIWTNHADGPITLSFYVQSVIGNITSAKVVINKDTVAPYITINSPNATQFNTAPSYDLTIIETNIDEMWYTLSGDPTATLYFIYSSTGTIDSSAWNFLPNSFVNITFYIRDKAGNENSAYIIVQKISRLVPNNDDIGMIIMLTVIFSLLTLSLGTLLYVKKRQGMKKIIVKKETNFRELRKEKKIDKAKEKFEQEKLKRKKQEILKQERIETARIEREKLELERHQKERALLDKIEKVMNVSTRIRIDMLRDFLNMDQKTFNNKIIDWATQFGFTIDGDYLILRKESVSNFIDELERQFGEWGKEEETQQDKI